MINFTVYNGRIFQTIRAFLSSVKQDGYESIDTVLFEMDSEFKKRQQRRKEIEQRNREEIEKLKEQPDVPFMSEDGLKEALEEKRKRALAKQIREGTQPNGPQGLLFDINCPQCYNNDTPKPLFLYSHEGIVNVTCKSCRMSWPIT